MLPDKYVKLRNLFMDCGKHHTAGFLNSLQLYISVVFLNLIPIIHFLLIIIYKYVFLCILIYVDDLVITGNYLPSIIKCKDY